MEPMTLPRSSTSGAELRSVVEPTLCLTTVVRGQIESRGLRSSLSDDRPSADSLPVGGTSGRLSAMARFRPGRLEPNRSPDRSPAYGAGLAMVLPGRAGELRLPPSRGG